MDHACPPKSECYPSISFHSNEFLPDTGIAGECDHSMGDVSQFQSELSGIENRDPLGIHDNARVSGACAKESITSDISMPWAEEYSCGMFDLASDIVGLNKYHSSDTDILSHDVVSRPPEPSAFSTNRPITSSHSSHSAAHSSTRPGVHFGKQTSFKFIMEHCDGPNSKAPSINSVIFQEVEEEFMKLSPALQNLNPDNFYRFLENILKTRHRHIPVHDLFNLFYDENIVDYESLLQSGLEDKEHSESMAETLKAMMMCHLIIRKIQCTQPTIHSIPGSGRRPLTSSLNYHEFLRSFLAMKVLFASVKPVGASLVSEFSIPRHSVYQVYVIICQKLLQGSRNISNCADQSIILGTSKFGKLAKLVFPSVTSKRLGKRGHSKPHYMGLVWDKTTVTPEILHLLELETPQLYEHFKTSETPRYPTHMSENTNLILSPKSNEINFSSHGNFSGSEFSCNKPIQTYIDISYTYPDSDCSPRVWDTIPNTVPQHSQWAQGEMQRSLKALKAWNIDLNCLIQNFRHGNFAGDNKASLSRTVYQAIIFLRRQSAAKQSYLHLYLVILVMIFPVGMSSDTEVSPSKKAQFRDSVKICMAKLEYEMDNFGFEDTNLKTFIGILRRMLSLSEMSSCQIKAPYAEGILNQMIGHLGIASTVKPNSFNGISPIEEVFSKAVILSINSYGFKMDDNTVSPNYGNAIESISLIAKHFSNTISKTTELIRTIPKYSSTMGNHHVAPDVAFQVLNISLKIFHQVTLDSPLMLKLPMTIITSIIQQFSNWIQPVSFYQFQKGSPDFAKEYFKCCWVYASMYMDYMRVISEVVALSEAITRYS